MTAKEKVAEKDSALGVNERKWGSVNIKAGWTMIPNVIFERQAALGLDAIDINIIMHLAGAWWEKEGKPQLAKGTIAKAMQIDPRTVQRRIAAMEKAGFIKREQRRRSNQSNENNRYHLEGLAEAAQPYAQEKIAIREGKAAAKAAAAARKGKPKLHLVS